LAYLPLRY